MYAAHFAAALAIKARVPRAPASALIAGAFLPDFAWIVLARTGIEPEAPFFDGWSHSLASIGVEAALFAALFLRRGRDVAAAMALAVLSHAVLDAPVHPQGLELYPHARLSLGDGAWSWGQARLLGVTQYWWLQLAATAVLLGLYALWRRSARIPANLAAASVVLVLSLHLMNLH